MISFYAGNLFPSNFKSVFLAFNRFNFGFFRLFAFVVALVVVVAFVVVVLFALLNDLLNSFAIEYAPSTILLSAVIWFAVVKVRTYKIVKGKKVYSNWSKVKTVTAK